MRRLLLACVLLAIIAGYSSGSRIGLADEGAPLRAAAPQGPNVVLIVADDMRRDDLRHMPKTLGLVARQGITYENAFVTTPVCCPSRASILRGQYAHNHRVLTNRDGFGIFKSSGGEASSIATWLDGAGYKTALMGKYLNGYGVEDAAHVPPGWDEWYAQARSQNYTYFDYDLSENGTVVHYGTAPEDYMTDVLAHKAEDFVQRSAGPEPFFLYLTPITPHHPLTPAPRHEGLFADAQAPRVPSFNESGVKDKPAWVRDLPLLSTDDVAKVDHTYRTRLAMLQALDEMVEGVVGELAATGELDNTYIVFTSDNGMHMGEHRIAGGKGTAYEESIAVPLVIRGPGIPAERSTGQIALNIDLAPTIAGVAGVEAPPGFAVDGRSLEPTFASDAPDWRGVFLEEGWGAQAVPQHKAVRTATRKYVRYATGEKELYDLTADPYQLNNLMDDGANPKRLREQLAALKGCSGDSCRAAEGK